MQSLTYPGGNLNISLGERRGRLDLAPSLDLSWTRAASDCVYSRAYPSPPMSGSPPLPPRSNPKSSNPDIRSYVSAGQDHGPRPSTAQQEYQEGGMGLPAQAFQERSQVSYAPYRPGDVTPQLHYQQPQQLQHQRLHAPVQQPVQHMYPAPGPSPFSPPERPPMQRPIFSPTRAQRKTKGHVASACVPCKKAHLR